jgi:putative Holliday junction resolvase
MGLLGIDLGDRRIGVAVVDADGGRARPLVTIQRGRDVTQDVAALMPFMQRYAVTEVVVGLPLDVSGGEGGQARITREWVEAVVPLLGVGVCLRDERFTSHLAEERLGPMKRGRSGGPPTPAQRRSYRSQVDREAAAIILQDELDARAGGNR